MYGKLYVCKGKRGKHVLYVSTLLKIINQVRVVRKPVSTNPGLKVNRSINSSCLQLFSASYFLFSLRLIKFKSERQKYKQKTSPKSRKTQIKILVNPGLA